MTLPTPRPAADAADGALVCRVADGDAGALEALYDRYGRPAFALARRITGEPVGAQAVVREVFLELWREPARYDPARGGFPSWLLAATHHRAVEAVRRDGTTRGRRGALAEAGPPAAGSHGDRVRRALDTLPPPQREAVALAYYTGYTQGEIAEQTGTPIGAVRAQLLAGMRRLRGLLDHTDVDGGADAGGAR
jgi:RNA polymerase sigma-70 factor (ECF subfamily)